jgi:hypothetical protein
VTVPRPGPQGQEVWHEDNGERSRGRAHHDCRHHDGDGTGGGFHHSRRHGLRGTGTVDHGIRQGPAGRFRAPADAVRQTNEDALVCRGVQRRRAGAYGVPGFLSHRQVRGVEQGLWRLHQGDRSSSAGLLGRSALNKPQQPVVGVNWIDAKTYCEYRGKRLPTEAEWEKAARGPHGNLYPWGNDFDSNKANYDRHHDATLPVDSHPEGASYYGVYNMAGNVFEWVGDWYDPKYYGRLETMVNPTGPEKPLWIGGTGTYVDRLTVGEKRVIRGGSWIAPEGTIRSTHRFWNHPLNNSYGVGLGFRCAKAAPADWEQRIRDSYITALVEMGRERFSEASRRSAGVWPWIRRTLNCWSCDLSSNSR